MNIYYLLFIITLFTSCGSVTSLQDGRTLNKDEIEVTPFVAIGKSKDVLPDAIDQDEADKYSLPILGLRAKFGFADKFDAGIVIDLATNFGLTAKYQFVGNSASKFNSSIGLDFGANVFLVTYDRLNYYYSVPLYMSYHPNKFFCGFLTTRILNNSDYVFREKYSRQQTGMTYSINNIAYSYGLLFGKTSKFGLEISHVYNRKFASTQFAVGYLEKF